MPTHIAVGPWSLDTYTLAIGLATLGGAAVALRRAGDAPARARTANGLLVIAALSLLAGRAGYVLLRMDYFGDRWGEMLSAASPGFSEQAALAGGLAGAWLASRLRWPVDGFSLIAAASLVGAAAAMGCIPHGCGYGREVYWTEPALWPFQVDWPDAYRANNPRLPTQLALAAWLMACLAALAGKKRRSGSFVVPAWLALFAIGDFALQFARGDPVPALAGLRAPQWLDALLVAAAAAWGAAVRARLATVKDRR
jgi:prolipoprotein diacylglyceryltransferase